MRICLLFNPRASSAAAIEALRQRLDDETHCLECRLVDAGSAKASLRRALSEGADRLVVAGGDGTLQQVVEALAPDFPKIDLALLPFGAGNDLSRSLGLAESVEAAIEAALTREAVAIDVVRLTTKQRESWFVNVANGGLGGRVARDVTSDQKRRWGPLAYWISTFSVLVDPEVFQVELTLDGERREDSLSGLAIANGRFVGGGFPMAPAARLDDGLLDVVTVGAFPKGELLAAGRDMALGNGHPGDHLKSYRAREVGVRSRPAMPFSIDGEPSRRYDATFQTVPAALRVVAGANPVAVGHEGERPTRLPLVFEDWDLSPTETAHPDSGQEA